jgi:hypothetical protein
MNDDNINDDLNSEEFNDYLGKYNDYFEKNKPNDIDLSFLDKKEYPTDDDVIRLFITKDDFDNSVDISNYDLRELGEPNAIKTLEGTEWKVSKLVWFKPEGRVISFALIKVDEEFDLENIPWAKLASLQKNALIDIPIDIPYEEVKDIGFKDRLDKAVEVEDYQEAAKLRDWAKHLNVFVAELDKAINKGDVDDFYDIIYLINEHKNKL